MSLHPGGWRKRAKNKKQRSGLFSRKRRVRKQKENGEKSGQAVFGNKRLFHAAARDCVSGRGAEERKRETCPKVFAKKKVHLKTRLGEGVRGGLWS